MFIRRNLPSSSLILVLVLVLLLQVRNISSASSSSSAVNEFLEQWQNNMVKRGRFINECPPDISKEGSASLFIVSNTSSSLESQVDNGNTNVTNVEGEEEQEEEEEKERNNGNWWTVPESLLILDPDNTRNNSSTPVKSISTKFLTGSELRNFCPSNKFFNLTFGASRDSLRILTISQASGTLQFIPGQDEDNEEEEDDNDNDELSKSIIVQRKDYCLVRRSDDSGEFRICIQDRKDKKVENITSTNSKNMENPLSLLLDSSSKGDPPVKIQKCCDFHQVLDMKSNCVNITNATTWAPVYYVDGVKLQDENPWRRNPVTPGPRELECPSYIIISYMDDKYLNLLTNGSVVVINGKKPSPERKSSAFNPGQFCIDGIIVPSYDDDDENDMTVRDNNANGSKGQQLHVYPGSEWQQAIVVCKPKPDVPSWMPLLFAGVNIVAALFLLITAMVYVIVWSQHNIHGWLQFAYTGSLCLAFTFLAVVQMWSQQIFDHDPNLCTYLGWLIHFTILSSFFWLTSMNFDLWWRFSGRRYMLRIRSKPCRENVKRFTIFALFSVGFPVMITTAAVWLDKHFRDLKKEDGDDDSSRDNNTKGPEEGPEPLLFGLFNLPRFGKEKCFFQNKLSQFPFLYLPIGILLLINLAFFWGTVRKLRRIHTNTELARSQSTLEDKKGFRLISKLFFVMGILWIGEFVSYAVNLSFKEGFKDTLLWIFMPTEIMNSLQGIAIFVIFVWKPSVLNQLRVKFGLIGGGGGVGVGGTRQFSR